MALAESAGLTLDPWQRFSLDVILAERRDGKWAAFETGELVARQNGKGGVIEALGLASLFLFVDQLAVYSAHLFPTALEHFRRMWALIENTDELRKRCKVPRTSHGEEGFERQDGRARFKFVARSRKSLRGFTGDRLILDEAQELSRSAIGAVLPTLSTRPNPQVNYFGTPPEESNDSEHWESVRDRGRSGGDPSLAWLEWASQHPDDLDSEVGLSQANPALGIRITREACARERASMDDEQYGRERLTLWGAGAVKTVISADEWFALEDRQSKAGPRKAWAVDVSPDHKHASIGVASDRADGLRHVELVENRSGTAWVPSRMAELKAKWGGDVALDPASPAGSLLSDLIGAGVDPVLVSGREMTQACGEFYTAATDSRVLRHIGQPKLNVAVDAGRKRTVQDAWAWHRRDATSDISPLVAVTLASHLLGVPSTRRERSGQAMFA